MAERAQSATEVLTASVAGAERAGEPALAELDSTQFRNVS